MTYKRNNNNNLSNNILSFDNNPSPIKKTRNSNDDNDNDDEEYTEPKDLDDTTPTTTKTTTSATSINNFLNFSNTSFNSSFNSDSNNISQDDYDEDSEGDSEEELNLSLTSDDILLSQIEILKSEWDFEVYNKCVPVVLQSIFHLSNKEKTERSLEQLKKKGLIRIFQIATSLNDYCIAITKDYIRCIDDLKSTKPTTTSPTKITKSITNTTTTSPIKSTPINTILLNRSEILELFKLKLIPYYNQVSISKQKLQQLLQIDNKTTHQIDNIITVLVQCGLILQTQEDNIFIFCVPGTGTFFSNLIRGRKEVISSIQRLKYKEILKKDLLKKKLVYSNVKMDILYKDLLGSGKIKVIPTTQGDLIRCIEFNEL